MNSINLVLSFATSHKWGVHDAECTLTGTSAHTGPSSLLGPKNSKVLLIPYRDSSYPQILFVVRSPSLTSRRIRTRDFASPTVEHYTLGSPRSNMSVNANFPFSSFGISLYHDFATHDTKLLVLQPSIPEA
jgi:hypothetical protein